MAHPTYKDAAGATRSRKADGNAGSDADPDVLYEFVQTKAAGAFVDGSDVAQGATTDAAVSTDAAGTVNAHLRGALVNLVALLARLPAALGAGGGLKVDGSGTALPVSGTVAVTNAGLTNLDIALSALRDAVTKTGATAKTLADLATLLAGGLPAALDGATGGLKVSLQDRLDKTNDEITAYLAAAQTLATLTTITNPVTVKGTIIDIAFTLSLDTAAYADGDVLADTQDLGAVGASNGQAVTLLGITLNDEDDQGQALDLLFLTAANSLGTENLAPNISDANARVIVGRVPIAASDWYDLGGVRVANPTITPKDMVLGAGTTSLYMGAISRGTGTYTASGITGHIIFQRH